MFLHMFSSFTTIWWYFPQPQQIKFDKFTGVPPHILHRNDCGKLYCVDRPGNLFWYLLPSLCHQVETKCQLFLRFFVTYKAQPFIFSSISTEPIKIALPFSSSLWHQTSLMLTVWSVDWSVRCLHSVHDEWSI